MASASSRVAARCSFVGKQAVVGDDRIVSEHHASRNHRIATDAAVSPDNATHQPGVVSNGNTRPQNTTLNDRIVPDAASLTQGRRLNFGHFSDHHTGRKLAVLIDAGRSRQ